MAPLVALLLLVATSAPAVVFEGSTLFPPSGGFRLAAAGTTAVIVFWNSPDGAGMRYARWGDTGPSVYSLLGVPHVRPAPGTFPSVAGDGAGGWLVAWIESAGGARVSRSSDDGVSWQEPVDIGLVASEVLEVAVAAPAPGTWLVAALSEVAVADGTDTLVTLSRSDGGGSWEPPFEFTRAHNAPMPRPGFTGPGAVVIAAGDGTAVLGWTTLFSSGPRRHFGAVSAFRSTNGGTWWAPISVPPLEGFLPSLVTNGSDGWAMVAEFWRPTDSPPSIPHQVRGVYSTDDAGAWQATTTILNGDVGLYGPGPALAAVGSDKWFVAMWDTLGAYGPSGLAIAHRCGANPSWSPPLHVPGTTWSEFQVAGRADELLLAAQSESPPGIVVVEGNTSADCSGCDDGDACTVDAGDAEVGCTHTLVAALPGAQAATEAAKAGCADERSAHASIRGLRRATRTALRAQAHPKRSGRLVKRGTVRTHRTARLIAKVRARVSPQCATALDAAVAACTRAFECAGR
jgi:hypothetical protein